MDKLPSEAALDAVDGVNKISYLVKIGEFLHPNLGSGSVHVAAEETLVPAECSNSMKFLIFAVLSAARVCIMFIRLENIGADIRGYPHSRKVLITTVSGGVSTQQITFKVRHLKTHKEYVL